MFIPRAGREQHDMEPGKEVESRRRGDEIHTWLLFAGLVFLFLKIEVKAT